MLSNSSKSISLFLFAHQDDEFAVYSVIEDSIRRGFRPICFYFTSGNFGGQDSQIRNNESIAVLQKLGVDREQLFFIGEKQQISDGKLHLHLDSALSTALNLIATLGAPITSLYAPAWEGGHQDHDAVNLIARVLAPKVSCKLSAWQSPFYNGCGLPGILYNVLLPLPANGAIKAVPIQIADRMRYIQLCSHYRSQIKTWVGLLPFVILNYFFDGTQKLQPIERSRVLQKPHEGQLLYERRKFCTYTELKICAEEFLKKNLDDEANQ